MTTATSNGTVAVAKDARAAGRAIEEVTPRQVQEWLRTGAAVLIDVREPDEHARERIGGAVLAPLSRFDPGAVAAMVKPGQRIVVHCKSGRRSLDAARLAGSVPGVASMTGGIEAWKRENLPVQINTKVSGISVMRQVQLVIGLGVLAGSALAWFVHPGFIALTAFFGAGLTFAGASGTCGMATVIGMMPWNKGAGGSCGTGSCG